MSKVNYFKNLKDIKRSITFEVNKNANICRYFFTAYTPSHI